jgi:hypothetical protein
MLIKRFIFLLIFSYPVCAVVTPDEFIESYIKEKDYGEIYKIDLLVFKNQFIEEVDLKEKWEELDPLDLSEELFMIKDQPTLLVEKPVFKEKNQNFIIKIKLEDSLQDKAQIEGETTEEQEIYKLKFNLFERILFEKEFEGVKKKIDKNKDYQVLHSISWYQPLVEKDKSVFIFVENFNGQTKTYGEILIYKDRYLHLDAKLRLSEKTDFQTTESSLIKTIDFNESLKSKSREVEEEANNSYWMETIFNNIKVNIGDFSKWILNNEITDSPLDLTPQESIDFKYKDLYEISQEIKIEENKYHFIDHPYFGIIIRISSLQAN